MARSEPIRRLGDWADEQLEAIASAHGTPVYVLDLDRVRENLSRVRAAFPDTAIHYAVKANAGGVLLETLAESGIGAECASAGEVTRAIDAGFDPARILYTPVNPPARDLDAVVGRWQSGAALTITAGARDTIARLAERGYDGRVALRVHPGVGAGHDEAVSTGADAKFGVPVDEVGDLARSAVDQGMRVVAVHAHTGSGLFDKDIGAHRAVVETLVSVASDLDENRDIDLEFVDIGGGFGVPYHPSESPLDLDRIAASTRDALAGLDVELAIEPGRYLVADAGVLLTAVNTVKESGDGYLAGVDAGMTDLLRPALYDAYHGVRTVGADSESRPDADVSVVGPICESTDVLARDRSLPRPRRGDLLAVGNAGAYGIEMANQYNSRPRPPVVALEDGETRVIRRRETIDDVVAAEVD